MGSYQPPENFKGGISDLIYKERIIGRVVRTRKNVKPVFVSVGHRITLDQACAVILNCAIKFRLPEPTRLAHLLVTSERKKYH